jgi:predicted amidophosphoribosyltransferase
MPLSQARERERGYNQVTIIAQAACAQLTTPHYVDTNVLFKTQHTPPQTSLDRRHRAQNVANAFTVTHNFDSTAIKGNTVVLLDDVYTTGATMAVARAALRPHLPSTTTLICLALAH